RSSGPTAARWAKSRMVIARTFATRSRRRTRPRRGDGAAGICAPRSSTISPRIWRLVPTSSRRAWDARLFTYAAWADKWDGAVHHTPIRGVTHAMNEPVGVLGIAAPDQFPLLGFVSLFAPA